MGRFDDNFIAAIVGIAPANTSSKVKNRYIIKNSAQKFCENIYEQCVKCIGHVTKNKENSYKIFLLGFVLVFTHSI